MDIEPLLFFPCLELLDADHSHLQEERDLILTYPLQKKPSVPCDGLAQGIVSASFYSDKSGYPKVRCCQLSLNLHECLSRNRSSKHRQQSEARFCTGLVVCTSTMWIRKSTSYGHPPCDAHRRRGLQPAF